MRKALTIIVLAQFLGTSLWFTPNAVLHELTLAWGISAAELGHLTSAVQLGFISGTLVIAVSGLADRWPASRIFAFCALAGAFANAAFAFATGLGGGLFWRFLTGLCLAGIYPIGMKLAAGWAPEHKGMALGWLVGMLALGTAFPHAVRGVSPGWDWQWVVMTSSVLAVIAGVMVARLGDGAHLPATGRLNWRGVFDAFRKPRFRAAVFGYFGHMWELYAVWALAPLLIAAVLGASSTDEAAVSLAAFTFIAIGGLGCILGGHASRHLGSARVAAIALAISGLLCLTWPWLGLMPAWLVIPLMLVWGFTVVADSPQFSALAASAAPEHSVGSSLAVMNSVGFLITVFAIELTASWWQTLGPAVTWLLLAGPVLGLIGMRSLLRPQGRELIR